MVSSRDLVFIFAPVALLAESSHQVEQGLNSSKAENVPCGGGFYCPDGDHCCAGAGGTCCPNGYYCPSSGSGQCTRNAEALLTSIATEATTVVAERQQVKPTNKSENVPCGGGFYCPDGDHCCAGAGGTCCPNGYYCPSSGSGQCSRNVEALLKSMATEATTVVAERQRAKPKTKSENVPCGGGFYCPDGDHCCAGAGGTCCPNGYYCPSSGSGKCTRDVEALLKSMATEATTAVAKKQEAKLEIKSENVPCGGGFYCPDGDHCCAGAGGTCCPNGYYCPSSGSGQCTRNAEAFLKSMATKATTVAAEKQEAKPTIKSDNVPCGGGFYCPDGDHCCAGAGGTCCPNGYYCPSSGGGQCSRNVEALLKSMATEATTVVAKKQEAKPEIKSENVPCGGGFYCPDGDHCCAGAGGTCCPNGYYCPSSGGGQCSRNVEALLKNKNFTVPVKKQEAAQKSIVV